MEVFLDQAVEIYARVLKHRHRDRAPRVAHTRALECDAAADVEGLHIWTSVAKTCETLGTVETAGGLSPAADVYSVESDPWRPACGGDEQTGASGSTGATP